MTRQFTTIYEFLEAHYGAGITDQIAKADAPITSATSGYFNAVYGAMAFQQINQEANAFGILPKIPWQHSGYRAITADAGSAGDGNISETSSLPDEIKPTVVEIDVSPKEVTHVFAVTLRQDDLSKKGDDVFGSFEQARPIMAIKHAKAINQQLLTDADTLAGTKFESIDRVTLSSAAASALGLTAGDEDIYDIDRSASPWSDAVVSHSSGDDRTLSLDLIDDVLASVEVNGGRTTVLLTGSDTKRRIIALARNHIRYAGSVSTVNVQMTLNGVQTDEGIDFGVKIASYEGIPMFVSQSVAKDTISRIYLLDTSDSEGSGVPRLCISLLRPTMYWESRADNGNGIVANDGYKHKGGYYTSGELICTKFNAQASIRDLK